MDDIASFRPGVQNNVPYTAAQLHAAADNFQRLSAGTTPWYKPYLSISHNDHLAFGRVAAARMVGDTLTLDAADVPTAVGAMVNARQLRHPSIEFYLPKYDAAGGLLDGLRGPDGAIIETPVIKALTFLGNQPPAVKGLPDLPVATFAHFDARPPAHFGGLVGRFSGDSPVDRTAMLKALADAGMDTSSITDAVPDEVVMAILTMVQKAAVPVAPEVPGSPLVAANADTAGDTATGTNTAGNDLANANSGAGKSPSAITVKFADASQANALQSHLDKMQSQFDALQANAAAQSRAAAGQQTAAKAAMVKRFCDELCGDPAGPRITPAQRPDIEQMLLATDHTAVRKFSDGKAQGTALDELMGKVKGWPVVRTFGEKLAAAVPASTPGRRAELLAKTPEGQAVLRREAAAAK